MTRFCPEVWEEDPVPEEVRGCEICGLYRQGTRMVWGEGNPEAKIMVILDNPGARESRGGESFVCGTRQTLQEAAFEVGFRKEELYVTYILKRRPVRAYDKPRTRELCMGHLRRQLEVKRPVLILCLGNVSVQCFFDRPEVDVKSLRGERHQVRGIPTVVSYHPLAVRRRPNLRKLFMADWMYLYKVYKQYI
ncbi:MAG TPA: uracil-DNA glycosylase [Bacillales bacterium]|nr:uracil-DNA glycosylase [Bacillales bacterium]